MNGPKTAMLKQVLNKSDAVDHLANVIAGLEIEILAEVVMLQNALEVEAVDGVPDQDERKEMLTELAQSQIAGDLDGFYVEHVLAEHVDQADRAKSYLGMDTDEWTEQIEAWAESYRETVEGDWTDRDLAEYHVRNVWDVTLEEFENRVIAYDQGEVMKSAMAGNMLAAKQAIRRCREEVEADA